MSSTVLGLFWDLAVLDPVVRVAAGAKLVRHLLAQQEEQPGLNEELAYCVKRLVKGLSSSRLAARQGFSMALIEILISLPVVTCKSVFELVDTHLDLTGEASSSRDGYYGRVFAIAALLKSKRLAEDPALFHRVTTDLSSFMQKKIYLRQCCCSLICSVVEDVSTDTIKAHVAPALLELFNSSTASAEALAIAISFTKHASDIRTLFPAPLDSDAFFNKTWTELFSEDHISALVDQLQQTSADLPAVHPVWNKLWVLLSKEKEVSLRSVWHHFVEQGLFAVDITTHHRKALGFSVLCEWLPHLKAGQISTVLSPLLMRSIITNAAVPGNYLNPASRHALGSIAKIAADSKDDSVRLSLISCLTGPHGSVRFDSLTKTKTVENIVSTLTVDGVLQYINVVRDVFLAAAARQVEEGEAEASEGQCEWALDQLLFLMRNSRLPRAESWYWATVCMLAVNAFCDVAKGAAATGEVVGEMLQPNPMTPRVRALCVSRFQSIAQELVVLPPCSGVDKDRMHSHSLEGMDDSGRLRLHRIAGLLRSLAQCKKVTFVTPLIPEAAESVRKLWAEVDKLDKAKASPETAAFRLLFLHTILQLYLENNADACGVAADLLQSQKALLARSAKEDIDAASVVVDILLSFLAKPSGLLRTMATRVFSGLLHFITAPALARIVDVVEKEDVLEEELSEESEEEEVEEEGGDDSEDSEEEEEEEKGTKGKKGELQKGGKGPANGAAGAAKKGSSSLPAKGKGEGKVSVEKGKAKRKGDDSDDSESVGEEEEQEEEEEEEEDAIAMDESEDSSSADGEAGKKGKTGGAAAKGSQKSNKEKSGGEGEEGEEDEEEWDDERMFALDELIAAQFTEARAALKKKASEAVKEAQHFKLRVLDLLDTFVRHRAESALLLTLPLPLLNSIGLAERQHNEAMRSKIVGLMNRLCASKTYPRAAELDVATTHALLERVLKLASSLCTPVAQAASSCSLFLIRVLVGGAHGGETTAESKKQKGKGKNNAEAAAAAATPSAAGVGSLDLARVSEILRSALQQLLAKKNRRIHPSFFVSLASRFPAVAWALWKDMIAGLHTTNSNFMRSTTLTLVTALLSNPAPSGGALQASGAEAAAAFAHILQQRTAFSAAMLRDVLRTLRLWAKRVQTEAVKVDASSLMGVVAAIAESKDVNPGVRSLCQQMCTLGFSASASSTPSAASISVSAPSSSSPSTSSSSSSANGKKAAGGAGEPSAQAGKKAEKKGGDGKGEKKEVKGGDGKEEKKVESKGVKGEEKKGEEKKEGGADGDKKSKGKTEEKGESKGETKAEKKKGDGHAVVSGKEKKEKAGGDGEAAGKKKKSVEKK